MKKQLYILLLCLTPLLCIAQISDNLGISKQDFKSENINGYDKICWKSDFTTKEVGNPELPIYRVSYVLPIDATVTGITFTTQTKQKHEQNFNIIPVQQPVTTDNSNNQTFTQPNKSVYQSTSVYPSKLYEIESDYFYMGYHLVTLRIYPFEYIPLTQTLYYYNQLEFTINYSTGNNKEEISPATQNLHRFEQCKSLVQSMVRNRDDVEKFGSNVQTIRDGKKIIQNLKSTTKSTAPQKIKSLSVMDEQVPDYIIITNNALKSSFQTLADWKTKKGVFTIIKTTEEISSNYSGTDLQEKIRNYIIESWGKWGHGLFFLLGGGNSIVPARMVQGDVYRWDSKTYGNANILYPTDMYYTTYMNNWNSNLNMKFAEHVYDLVNFNPYDINIDNPDFTLSGIFLGRIPVDNISEANIVVNKIIKYEKADINNSLSYLQNHLYADFFSGSFVSYYTTNTTSNIVKKYMVSGASGNYIEFNHDNFLNALNNGTDVGKYHLIYHMDHGGSQGIATSSDKNQGVNKSEMGSLSNEDAYQIFMSGSCHSANFTENCIAQYYLTNPNGGGLAYIGNTDWGLSGEDQQLKPFLSSLYNVGSFSTGRYDLGMAFQSIITSSYAPNKWHPHLLGDPEMQVWTGIPSILPVTLSPTAVSIGAQTVNVTVSGLSTGTTGRICFWKGTEVYVIQENVTNGTYPISFTANTPGDIKVTVTAHNFKPYENTITVNSTTNPNLSVSTVDFGDGIVQNLGIGNANGQNDAGETINLTLGIKNTGVNTANNVSATLSCSSQYITITSSQASLGNITSGSTVTSNQFNYTIDKNTPEILSNLTSPVQFIVTITDENSTTWTHKYNIDIFNDVLTQCNKTIVNTTDGDLIPEAGETVTMNIALQNLGKAPTNGLAATLTSSNGNCSINSGNATYATIAPLEIKNGNAAFSFNTSTSTLSLMAFNLSVTNAYGKTWSFPFTLSQPTIVTASSVDFSASETEIDLTWSAVSGVSGYNIYRCDVDINTDLPTGNYVKINSAPFQFAYYNDLGLQKTTKYSYKLTTISSTGNESDGVTKIAWTSYPSKNIYPRQLDGTIGTIHTPINVGDINNDGKKEVFVGIHGGTYKGGLVCLDYYGNEPYNIDNNVTTLSGFAQLGYDTWAIPAIGDLKKTGSISIIEPSRAGGNNKIFCYSAEDKSPIDGLPDLQWSTLTSTNQYLKGAVLSNIDNSPDGSLEIVTCSDERGPISMYNADGTLRANIQTTNTYGSIAVADVDGNMDGKKEIIHTANNGIYVWDQNGSNYNGVNPLFSTSLTGYNFVGSPIICDIDKDGNKDILAFAIENKTPDNSPSIAKLFGIKNDGSVITGFNGETVINTSCDWYQDLAVGDLNNDGYLEIVSFATDGIKVWNHSGTLKTITYPLSCTNHPVGNTPILADIDLNHSDVEILFGSANQIYAFKLDGSVPVGFPLRTKESNMYSSSLAVSDVDNDGKNEVVSAGESYVDMWQTDGIPSKIEWGTERHDQYNTGEYYQICEPTIINTSSSWNTNQSLCNDLIIKSGNLTINNNSDITMASNSMIIVMSGATLTLDSGKLLNCNVRALAGSSIIVKNNGKIVLRPDATFYTETGTNLEIQYGSIEK